MGKTKIIELTEQKRRELENGWRNGTSHAFRQRCQMVLLKSEPRTSLEISRLVGSREMTVNNWLGRYQAEGFKGLQMRPGRGRKSILRAEDFERVKAQVQVSRQRISLARAELEASLAKGFSLSTLKRFLKKTVAATNALEND
ncbi:MAG: helix-turn-helix domain-containing protein [Acidobacteriota bacterium]|nr:helix-turn-helix domain-containing protein [Acidobacteriota bacterium]